MAWQYYVNAAAISCFQINQKKSLKYFCNNGQNLQSQPVNCLYVALLPFWGVSTLTPVSPPAPCTLWCNSSSADAISNFTLSFTDAQFPKSIFTLFYHMFSRDISVKMGNCHDTVYGIFWLPNKVSWSSSVCGLTDVFGNWQHRQDNSTPSYGNKATLWVFVCHPLKAFRQIQLTPSGLLQKCCGPLGNCIHAGERGPHNGLRPARHWHRLDHTTLAHRPPIFWFRWSCRYPDCCC